jgi:Rieske Fe-S protein
VATEAICPHEGGNLLWQQSSNKIQCDKHSATYSSSGTVLSGPIGGGSTRALKIYTITLTGTTLTATKS